MGELRSKEYPFDLIVKIADNYDDIDIDWVAKNFDENLNYLFEQNKSVFSKSEYEVLLAYYKDGLSIEEIAKNYCTSTLLIRQMLNKTTMKLQYPSLSKYILYGKDVEEKLNNLRKNKEYYLDNYERINDSMNEEDVEKLIIDDCKKNHDQSVIDKKLEYLNLPINIFNILKRNRIDYIVDLLPYKRADLMKLKNMTEEYCNIIEKKLNELSDI